MTVQIRRVSGRHGHLREQHGHHHRRRGRARPRSRSATASTPSTIAVTVSGTTTPPPPPSSTLPWRVLASNDLGMHCADLDYQIFSILPPFNVVHAQVVQTGNGVDQAAAPVGRRRRRRLPRDVEFGRSLRAPARSTRRATSRPSGTKSNFWQPAPLPNGTAGRWADSAYRSLYPGAVLDLFAPIPAETGLARCPTRRRCHRWRRRSSGCRARATCRRNSRATTPTCRSSRASRSARRWSAPTGSPRTAFRSCRSTTPGRTNPYPLMRVQAVAKGADRDESRPTSRPASTSCCPWLRKRTAATATTASTASPRSSRRCTNYANGTPWADRARRSRRRARTRPTTRRRSTSCACTTRSGARSTRRARDGAATPCNAGTESSCLDQRRAIQCSQCHYSPALDLAQVGPIDEPAVGVNGRQQTRHISMSRAMHYNHGQYTSLFPAMPLPKSAGPHAGGADRHPRPDLLPVPSGQADEVPARRDGRRRRRVPGLPRRHEAGRQRLHRGLPGRQRAPTSRKRVPWAVEPKCQSCHVGDAKSVTALNRADHIVAPRRHPQPAGLHEEQRDGSGREDHRRARLALRREPEALPAIEGTRRRVLPGLPRRHACRVAESESAGQRQHRGLAAAGPQRNADRVHHLPRGRLARADAEWTARHASGQRRELDGQAQRFRREQPRQLPHLPRPEGPGHGAVARCRDADAAQRATTATGPLRCRRARRCAATPATRTSCNRSGAQARAPVRPGGRVHRAPVRDANDQSMREPVSATSALRHAIRKRARFRAPHPHSPAAAAPRRGR